MRKCVFFVCSLLLCCLFSIGQSSRVTGAVRDTVENRVPVNAVVALLRPADSVLVQFTRTDKAGHFSFDSAPAGNFLLMVTHPYMGDYFDNITVTGGVNLDMGILYVTPKTKLLAEVIVRSGSPIRVKGDTVVYTADSFKVRPGANVEELLRRLPGISVDRDGKITAMGERVKKVLVDGEEFFGSDPGIATKNLRADAVKEVEVFDKKSDQAEFTGIDDGVKDKTINLKMKQQQGYFGKVELAGGLKDKYNNAAMINSFRNKRKMAAYGIMSNTGQTNLDWQDAQNYGGGADGMQSGISDDGGVFFIMNGNGDGYGNGSSGIPQNWNGGLHYSNKFGKDNKQSFNTSYKVTKINAPGETRTYSQVFLPDSSWNANSRSNRFNSTVKQAVNLTMDFNLDSLNSLKFTARLNKKNIKSTSDLYSEALANSGDTINNSRQNNSSKSDNSAVNATLLWRHKFKKLSRTLSVNTDFSWSESNNSGYQYSLNRYFDKGLPVLADTIDQQNSYDNAATGISTRLAYTEPLSKTFYMELSYLLSYNTNSSDRRTNARSPNGKYEDAIDSLSNSYVFDRLVHTPGLNFRMNKKKYNYSFGTAVGFSHFIQKNITEQSKTRYNYTNFFPRAAFNYKFKASQNLHFGYTGSTNAPTLEQLQPIKVNTDPLNIYVGNPGLVQSFRHNFDLNYNSYNVLKERNIWTDLNFTTTQHSFVQSSVVDSLGRRTYQTVNASGVYQLSFNSDYGFKIGESKVHYGVGPQASLTRNVDFINGVRNNTTTSSYGFAVNIRKNKENKYDLYLSPSFSWNHSRATVNSAANANYWMLEGWAEGRVMLPKKFEVGANVDAQLRQKDPRFSQNNNFTKLNLTLTKRFFKNNDFEMKFGVYDVLNQNRGYERNFDSYSFRESYYTTLRRFWLLTLTWNISKNGKPASFGF